MILEVPPQEVLTMASEVSCGPHTRSPGHLCIASLFLRSRWHRSSTKLCCGMSGPGCSPDLDWGVWHLVVQALSTLFVSQHPCTLHEWNLGFSSSFNCPSSQGELSLLCRTPRPRHQVCFSFFLSFAALIEWVPVPFVWIYWFFTLLYVLFSQISLAFYFSVKHLHFFKLCNFCLVLSHTFYLFVEVLTVLIHSAPDFSNHLHDHHF